MTRIHLCRTVCLSILWPFLVGLSGLRAAEPEASFLSGTVVSATTGEPLRKARLTLEHIGGKLGWYTEVSDGEGRFQFRDIEAGTYRLEAARFGYLDGSLGALRPGAKGKEIQIAQGGKLTGQEFRLWPQAGISGRVVDVEGDPLPGISVSVYRVAWRKGRRQLEGVESNSANDRAEFRIAPLLPGNYYLTAQPPQQRVQGDMKAASQRPRVRDLMTWYPGVLSAESATPLVLAPGQELAGIEIRLQRGAAFTIRGKVTGLARSSSVSSGMRMRWPYVYAAVRSSFTGRVMEYGGVLASDFTFTIPGVPPGSYDVGVRQGSDSWSSPSSSELGRVSIEVGQKDVDQVVLEAIPDRPVQGRVQIEPDGLPPSSRVSIGLVAETTFGAPAKVEPDGQFRFEAVGRQRYEVLVHGDLENTYIRAVRVGGVETAGNILDLTRDQASAVEIFVSTRAAQVQGKIHVETSTGKPPEVDVWLVPEGDGREREGRQGTFDQSGMFTIRNLPPGRYRLYASEELPEGAWQVPGFEDRFRDLGTPVEISEGERKQVEVTPLPSDAVAQWKAAVGMW